MTSYYSVLVRTPPFVVGDIPATLVMYDVVAGTAAGTDWELSAGSSRIPVVGRDYLTFDVVVAGTRCIHVVLVGTGCCTAIVSDFVAGAVHCSSRLVAVCTMIRPLVVSLSLRLASVSSRRCKRAGCVP